MVNFLHPAWVPGALRWRPGQGDNAPTHAALRHYAGVSLSFVEVVDIH
jgi:hypothetical protein